MASFTDETGQKWVVTVVNSTIARVRAQHEINLYAVVDPKDPTMNTLLSDPVTLASVLYTVCKPQADERQLSQEAFIDLIAGDAISGATDALVEAVIDFFPKAKREPLRAIWGKTKEASERATAWAMEEVAKIDVNRLLAETLNESSSNAPAASA